MKRALIGSGIAVAILVGGLTMIAGPSPRDWWGLVRYALPRMHHAPLKVGDAAPDGTLVSLDGSGTTTLLSHLQSGKRPLVLVFGSFT